MIHLISPILYRTSSFDDIFQWINREFLRIWIPVRTNQILYKEFRGYGIENPDEYFEHALDTQRYLIENVRNGDTVIFLDFFFPWLDLVKYYFERNWTKIKMISLMHWASFISWDLYNWNWLKHFEKWWMSLYEYIIVPSNFFLENIKNNPEYDINKFIVLPWWLDTSIKPSFNNKIYDVIFPHRFDYDKWIFDLYEIVKNMPDITFLFPSIEEDRIINTYPKDLVNLYYKLKALHNITFTWMEYGSDHVQSLQWSKVVLSTALQEWFGYAIMKWIQAWNIPVLPNRCCYPEFFESKYLYNSLWECCELIRKFLKWYPENYFETDKIFRFEKIVEFINTL